MSKYTFKTPYQSLVGDSQQLVATIVMAICLIYFNSCKWQMLHDHSQNMQAALNKTTMSSTVLPLPRITSNLPSTVRTTTIVPEVVTRSTTIRSRRRLKISSMNKAYQRQHWLLLSSQQKYSSLKFKVLKMCLWWQPPQFLIWDQSATDMWIHWYSLFLDLGP